MSTSLATQDERDQGPWSRTGGHSRPDPASQSRTTPPRKAPVTPSWWSPGPIDVSTPTYAFILGAAGFAELTSRLRERQKAGDLEGMGKLVDDDVLAVFATEASWDGLADALRARYAGLSDRLVMYLGGPAWDRDRESFERFGSVARTLAAG